jgi:hypothetical protein
MQSVEDIIVENAEVTRYYLYKVQRKSKWIIQYNWDPHFVYGYSLQTPILDRYCIFSKLEILVVIYLKKYRYDNDCRYYSIVFFNIELSLS